MTNIWCNNWWSIIELVENLSYCDYKIYGIAKMAWSLVWILDWTTYAEILQEIRQYLRKKVWNKTNDHLHPIKLCCFFIRGKHHEWCYAPGVEDRLSEFVNLDTYLECSFSLDHLVAKSQKPNTKHQISADVFCRHNSKREETVWPLLFSKYHDNKQL